MSFEFADRRNGGSYSLVKRKTGEKVQKRKKSKKLVKKACKMARRMVLYLSAKR